VPQAKRQIVRRGRAIAVTPRGDRVVVAHDQRRTITIIGPGRGRSRLVDVGGQPLAVAVSPNARFAAVTTAFWDEPGLAIVDLRSGAVRRHTKLGPAPTDLAFTPDGRRLIVTGGEEDGTVHVLDTHGFGVLALAAVGLVPRGIAAHPGNRRAWIALNGLDRVVGIDLATGRIRRTISTGRAPDRVAVSPDGRRLLVSHGGRQADQVTEVALATGRHSRRRVGRLPNAVAYSRMGLGLVTLSGDGQVVVLGRRGAQRHIPVGGAPRGLAVARGYAWTVDALTGTVDRVRT
jgi:DNA-binding beta-propeller fold protein YncE